MKNLITTEEIEFIVLQLLDREKFDEAEELLKSHSMSRSEWLDFKTTRHHSWNLEDLD